MFACLDVNAVDKLLYVCVCVCVCVYIYTHIHKTIWSYFENTDTYVLTRILP